MMRELTRCIFFLHLPLHFLCSIDSVNVTTKGTTKEKDALSLSLPMSYVKFQGNNALYTQRVDMLRNHTVDAKCSLGLDMGISYHVSMPYVGRDENSSSLTLTGIFPNALNEMIKFCCPRSKITYGKEINSTINVYREFDNDDNLMDITFPVHAHNGRQSTEYRGLPYIAIAEAPTIILLVPDRVLQERNTRTTVLMTTILNTWPMLIFIIVSAMLSGLVLWSLDRKKNPKEFPMNFFSGAWEGIWWAFVTMTTVGYGDRSPKSPYARAFCIIWILLGIILISLFTGLVSAALSVSSTPVFNIAGAKIGAVHGSIEYQLGVGLNAEMKRYENIDVMMKSLLEERKLDAILIDNFILSSHQETLKTNRLRIEREFSYPVSYGFVLSKGSAATERCFRRFIKIDAQKIFEIITDKLHPVKNPTDGVRVEVEAAEKLFYEEYVFKVLVCTETGLLVAALIFGTIWEIHVMNKDSAAYRFLGRFRKGAPFEESPMHEIKGMSDPMMENTAFGGTSEMHALLTEYDEYHNTWVSRVKNLHRGT